MADKRGYRNKMRDECVAMHATILKRHNVALTDLADEVGVSIDTARRWVHSFGLIMPVEIRRGRVIVGDGIM
jgi:hypothetical protein